MRLLVFLSILLLSFNAAALDCDKQPSCTELGYSTADNLDCTDDGYMYCPFDHSYKKCVNTDCAKMGFTTSDKTYWCPNKLAKCKGDNRYTLCKGAWCEIGDVYYTDSTCGYAEDYDGSKTPVGVVFYVTEDGRHGRIINLKNLAAGNDYFFHADTPYTGKATMEGGLYALKVDLKVYENSANLLQGLKAGDENLWDGTDNTVVMSESFDTSCYYTQGSEDYARFCYPTVAKATREFYPPQTGPADTTFGAGNWYLPSIGEWIQIYGYSSLSNFTAGLGTSGADASKGKNIINKTLNTLKSKNVEAEPLTDSYYWSSSLINISGVPHQYKIKMIMSNGERKDNTPGWTYNVRAALKF